MLRIAICDDTPLYISELAAQLHELAAATMAEVSVDTFRSYTALDAAHQENPYTLVFLEIALSDGDGIELASRWRRKGDDHTHLVFYSSSAARALEAYDVFPDGYLLKPPQKRRLREIFNRVVRMTEGRPGLVLRTEQGGRVRVPLDDIVYAEVFGMEIVVHTATEEFSGSGSLSDCFAGVHDTRFWRTHRSFVVNLDYVVSLERYAFTLRDGRTVAVAKNKYPEAKKILSEYNKIYRV